ncbi:hypothetical protein, partial [Williamwhitmania taraxaci]|uniref:hypothetical protein n=1 Tax=Williamwhitmania taraxaci TaxID=1640674 RepID=UPI001BAFDA37
SNSHLPVLKKCNSFLSNQSYKLHLLLEFRNQLAENIEHIYEDVLKVESERKWRYDLNTGMAVLKNNKTPLLTASERFDKSKKNKQLLKFVFNDITYSLALSVVIFIGLFSKNLIDSLKVEIVLIVIGISFIIFKIARFMTKLEISSFGKKRFLNREYSDYFEQFGQETELVAERNYTISLENNFADNGNYSLFLMLLRAKEIVLIK